jgi:HSP20 family protein
MKLRSLLPYNPYRSVARRHDPYEDMWQELEHMLNKRPFSDWGMGSVKIDVLEDKNGVTIKADLPGLSEDDIDITLFDTTLTIRGEKKVEKEEKEENFYMMERSFGSFSRSINLPYKADINKVDAEYKQGVLKITIPRPKTVEGQIKKIKVKSHSPTQKKTSKK